MDNRVKMVVRLIGTDLCREMTIAELARRVNLSLSRLRHLFKTEMGMSPAQYLKALRLQRAKDLLETTFLSVKQIMSHVGVSDKSRFAQDFKRAYGLTPARYRAHLVAAVTGKPRIKDK